MEQRQCDRVIPARWRGFSRRRPTVCDHPGWHAVRLRFLDGALMSVGRCALLHAALAINAVSAWAQLPEGPGKEQTQRICKQCHELERSLAPRQNREGWKGIVDKMVTLGARGSGEDFDLILDYLAKNFPAEELPKI